MHTERHREGKREIFSELFSAHEVSLQDTHHGDRPPWHFVPGFDEPSRWDEDRESIVHTGILKTGLAVQVESLSLQPDSILTSQPFHTVTGRAISLPIIPQMPTKVSSTKVKLRFTRVNTAQSRRTA
jgi:hypothetical protein